MHTAIAAKIMERYPIQDRERFLFGSILPDGAVSGNGHWRCAAAAGKQTVYLAGFRRKYGIHMMTDDLLLGYYLHLVQDLLFRQYLQTLSGWKVSRRYVKMLHDDYERLNGLLTAEYDLQKIVSGIAVQDYEPVLDDRVEYDAEALLAGIRSDVNAVIGRQPVFFSMERAREYIQCAAEKSLEELGVLPSGRSVIEEMNITWDWGKQRLPARISGKLRRIVRGKA